MLKLLYLLLLFLFVNTLRQGRERCSAHCILRVINNYIKVWVRLILRCVPHGGEAHSVPRPSVNIRVRDNSWQEAQGSMLLECLKRDCCHWTLDSFTSPASWALEAMCAPTRAPGFWRRESHLTVTPAAGPSSPHTKQRRCSTRTLCTVLAPVPLPPAQAPLEPPAAMFLPPAHPPPTPPPPSPP